VIDTVASIAEQADGIRCDMAMLFLNWVFERTWGARVGERGLGTCTRPPYRGTGQIGFGTTFAAVRDLAAMLKRRSNAVMNPGMAAIMGACVGAYDARPTQPLYDRVVLASR